LIENQHLTSLRSILAIKQKPRHLSLPAMRCWFSRELPCVSGGP